MTVTSDPTRMIASSRSPHWAIFLIEKFAYYSLLLTVVKPCRRLKLDIADKPNDGEATETGAGRLWPARTAAPFVHRDQRLCGGRGAGRQLRLLRHWPGAAPGHGEIGPSGRRDLGARTTHRAYRCRGTLAACGNQ